MPVHPSDDGSSGGVYLDFYEPDSSVIYQNPFFCSNGHYNFTAPQGGTWPLVLDPYEASAGSLTIELT